MKLNKIQRIQLLNQYRLLALADPDPSGKAHWEARVEILLSGYEGLYDQLEEHVDNVMSADASSEVENILELHDALEFSYQNLSTSNQAKIDRESFAFRGFDGNGESDRLVYCHFRCNEMGEPIYKSVLKHAPKDLNSHTPMMPGYRRMLAQWDGSMTLSAEDIQRITAARPHPKP